MDGNRWPFGSKSYQTLDSRQDWCPYDRELNAAHKAIRHFKHMVEGRPFTLYTDHQSLVPSIHKKTDAPTARQTNQLSEIAEFTTDIRYLEGKSNFVADALSRPNGILSNKAASVSNISSVANDRHVFLQHLDMLQSSATISSVCFCHHLKPIQSQPTISSISQPSRTASAADPPASRQCKVTLLLLLLLPLGRSGSFPYFRTVRGVLPANAVTQIHHSRRPCPDPLLPTLPTLPSS